MRILLPLKRQGLYYPQSRPKEMTVQTLGRVAYDTWGKVAGYQRNWDSPALSLAAKEPWEQAAKAVAAKVLEHFKEAPAPEQETYTRFGQEYARKYHKPRQGGMVNVHTKPPAHYNAHPSGVECIEVTRHLPFNLGNVVKYIWRAGLKENESEIKDLEKSLDYLNDEINKRKLALGITPSPLQELERLAAKVNGYGPDGKGHQ